MQTLTELLTVVFRYELSDDKPLKQILQKNLADAPAHLQWMMLCLQPYDFDLTYQSRWEMVLDAALLCYQPQPAPESDLHISMNHV